MRKVSTQLKSFLRTVLADESNVCVEGGTESEEYDLPLQEEAEARKLITMGWCEWCNDEHGTVTKLGKIAMHIPEEE